MSALTLLFGAIPPHFQFRKSWGFGNGCLFDAYGRSRTNSGEGGCLDDEMGCAPLYYHLHYGHTHSDYGGQGDAELTFEDSDKEGDGYGDGQDDLTYWRLEKLKAFG